MSKLAYFGGMVSGVIGLAAVSGIKSCNSSTRAYWEAPNTVTGKVISETPREEGHSFALSTEDGSVYNIDFVPSLILLGRDSPKVLDALLKPEDKVTFHLDEGINPQLRSFYDSKFESICSINDRVFHTHGKK